MDGGLAFKPIFDKYNQSIGAVTVDPAKPTTIWVGTGETWVRNSVSVGDGVYRSDRRRRELDEARPRRDRADRPHPRRSRRTATPCWSARPGTCSTTARTAACTARRTAARPGRRCSTWRPTPGAPTWRWTPARPTCSTPPCGSSGARRRSSPRAARRAACSNRPTAARPGSRSDKGLPAGDLGRIALARRAVEAGRRLRHGRGEEDRALPVRRPRRVVDGGERLEPGQHPPVLLLADGGRPVEPRPGLQDGHDRRRQQRRRQDVQRPREPEHHGLQLPQRRARHLGEPEERRAARHRHRRRRLHLARPRRRVAVRRQPAGGPVLPRQLRHGLAVQRLRRPAGQQFVVRAVAAVGRDPEPAVAVAVGRRRVLGVPRSDRPRHHLRRDPGRQPVPRPAVDAREQGHQAVAAEGRAEVPVQLEHADPHEPDAPGHDLLRRAVPLPLARPGRVVGADLARPDDQRPGRSSGSRNRAASRPTTPPPRTTARSSRSASRRRTATSSGSAPTTGTCR